MSTDIDKLESFYLENFSKDTMESFFSEIASVFVDRYFIEETIDNHIYEKDLLKLILTLISNTLHKKFSSSQEFNKDFSNYLFRKNLPFLFNEISQLLLEEIAYSNKGVIEFLKYYSQDIIVYEGKRYKVPELKGNDELRWSIVSMLGIVKTYIKAYDYIKEVETNKDELDKKVLSFYVNGLSPIEHNINVQKEFEKLEDKIKQNAQKIEILHESLEILNSDEYVSSINKELDEYKVERAKLREDKKALIKKRINQVHIYQYNELLKQLEIIHRDTKAEYKILEQNEKSFNSIKSALTKALLSKKQLVQ